MSPPFSSGIYVSRGVTLLLVGLTAALLLVLVVLAALYGNCARAPSEQQVKELSPPTVRELEPPTQTPEDEYEPGQLPGPRNLSHRLPPWVVPLHYNLELWPRLLPHDLSTSSVTFTGRVNITVRCRVATSRLFVHSHYLNLKEVDVWGPLDPDTRNTTVGHVPVDFTRLVLNNQYLELELGQALQPGSRYELNIDFSGTVINGPLEGLFRNLYTDQDDKLR